MLVWRICRRVHADTAFSGEGARLFSGRWNPAGIPMVYTSLSLALAAMEVLVHLDARTAPDDFVSVVADLPVKERSLERVDPSTLPDDWKRIDHPTLARLGVEWAQSRRSLVLLVPSVVIPGDWNALINPLHDDAAKIKVAQPVPFLFDERIFKARQGDSD